MVGLSRVGAICASPRLRCDIKGRADPPDHVGGQRGDDGGCGVLRGGHDGANRFHASLLDAVLRGPSGGVENARAPGRLAVVITTGVVPAVRRAVACRSIRWPMMYWHSRAPGICQGQGCRCADARVIVAAFEETSPSRPVAFCSVAVAAPDVYAVTLAQIFGKPAHVATQAPATAAR